MRRTPDAMPDSPIDLEQADVAGRARVGAAAELGRELAERDHAHAVAVLLAEDRDRAGRDRLGVAPSRAPRAGAFASIHWFTRSSICSISRRGERRVVGEVEAQPVGRDERALLHRLRARAPRAAPRAGGACPSGCARWPRAPRRRPRARPDRRRARSPDTTRPRCTTSSPVGRCVSRTSTRPRRRLDHAAVAHLAAALGVEGRLLDDHLDLVARARRRHRLAAHEQRGDVRARLERLVAAEARSCSSAASAR